MKLTRSCQSFILVDWNLVLDLRIRLTLEDLNATSEFFLLHCDKKSRQPNHPDQDVAIKIKRVHTYNVVESKRKVTFFHQREQKTAGWKREMGKIMARAILFWLEEVRRRALSDASFAFKLESIWN